MSDVALLSDDEVMGRRTNVSASGGPKLLSDDEVMGRSSSAGREQQPAGEPTGLFERGVKAITGGIANIAGAPVDAANYLVGMTPKAQDFRRRVYEQAGEKVPLQAGGSESIKKGLEALGQPFGVNTNPNAVTPATTLSEKAVDMAGGGVADAMMMGGAAGLLAKSIKAADSFGAQLAKIIAGTGATSNAVMGAGGGAAGAVAEDMVPETILGSKTAADFVRPLARMGGEVVGGGLAAGVESGVRALARPVTQAIGNVLPSPSVEEAAARKALKNVPLDRQGEFRTALANVETAPPPTVPEGPFGADRFGDARALDKPAAAPPSDTGGNLTLFQATGDLAPKLGELERTAITKNPATAMEVRQGQNEAWLTQLNEMYAADPRKALDFTRARIAQIEEEHAGLVTAARQEAEARAGQTGGAMFDDRAGYGEALQNKLDELKKQKSTAEGKLWDAFREVAGDKPLPFADAKPRVRAIADDLGQFDLEIEGKEAAIFKKIQNASDFATFKDIGRLQSQLKGIIRDPEESGETRYRMREVLKVIDDTMNQAVDRVVIDGERPLTEAMGNALTPDDVARYGVARAATRERAETFEEGAVGKVLKTGERRGAFRTTESAVMEKLLNKPEAIRDFVKAAGGDEKAMEIAQDALAFDMRRKAAVDGIISPEKLQGWMRDNTEAMKQFPDLQAKFANARTASETLDNAIAKQKEALNSAEIKAARSFLGDKDPHASLSEMMQRPEELRAVVDQIKQDPEAHAGLKRLAVELLLRRGKVIAEDGALEGAKEAGTSGKPQLALNAMQTYYYNNLRGFREIFDKGEIGNIGSVMGNIQKAARTEGGVRIPNQSNSAQDLWGIFKNGISEAWRKAGTAIGTTTGIATMDPLIGAPIVAGGIAADAWRTAYRGRMDAALADIMLDVRKAQIAIPKVIAKVEGKQAAIDEATVARKMRALLGQEVARQFMQTADSDEERSP